MRTSTPLPRELKEAVGHKPRFLNALAAAGWKPWGQGVYATVFGKDSEPFVIRVSSSAKYDGWLPYARWAKRARVNPRCRYRHLLPVIGDIYVMPDDQGFVAVMEKLESPRKSIFTMNEFTRKLYHLQELVSYLARPGVPKELPVKRRRVRENFSEAWVLLLERVVRLSKETGEDLDVHGGNIMCRDVERGMDTLVLTDPLA